MKSLATAFLALALPALSAERPNILFIFTDKTLDWLKNHKDKSKPFVLMHRNKENWWKERWLLKELGAFP